MTTANMAAIIIMAVLHNWRNAAAGCRLFSPPATRQGDLLPIPDRVSHSIDTDPKAQPARPARASYERIMAAPDGPGIHPQRRDLFRFLLVDIILILILKIMLGVGIFSTLDQYIMAVLGSKVLLAGYLFWLINYRRGWDDIGVRTAGRWWGWPAALGLYALFIPFMLVVGRWNDALLTWLYSLAGLVYEPVMQDVLIILYDTIAGTGTRIILFCFVVALGPVMEEFAFRGLGMAAFWREKGALSAIIWSSLLFGIYHFSIQTLLPLTLMGLLFAAVRVMARSLWCAAFIHCLHNTVVTVYTAYSLGWFDWPGS
ncbi:MAG: CPBP family intramembrane metalloprotease [Planctomycetes bacterium]|nr:CPBP family intramembrane metalloprotease [Planctomycetota bacterium]